MNKNERFMELGDVNIAEDAMDGDKLSEKPETEIEEEVDVEDEETQEEEKRFVRGED